MAYPLDGSGRDVEPSPSFPGLEERILDFWERDGTFRASIANRPAGENGSNEFVFYDGPPFANGVPHYGHLLTGYVKDLVPRYQTMRGRRVERRFGWDCHGLPAEMQAEHELGITTKRQILEIGIAKFNDTCRRSVLRYTKEWERYVTRQARWVDFDNDYKTLDLGYMESVLWGFKRLWDKGLVYEGFRVLPYCWRCETPLSNHELRMDDDVYRPRADPAVTVWFELDSGERLLVWTTTPWTLPSNLAVAVAPDVSYAVMERDGERYVLAEDRLPAYSREFGEDTDAQRVATLTGSELVGRRYRPMFDFLADTDNAFQVLAGDFVTVEDGTGAVHMAPAYGEDDQNLCAAAGIPVVLTVDDRAHFTDVVPDYAGMHVFDANPRIIADLKARGMLVRHETYEHSYPHCWRCDTPLVYKALSSWFVSVTSFRDRMVELNKQIDWVPEHIRDGLFGKWLENARDWSISRNRFWGNPLPVWRSDDPAYPRIDVYGSLAEMERDFGVRPTDLHRPAIDELTRPNPDDPSGRSTMRRVPEVLDVWFDSGSMPYAQVHHPFENAEWFEDHYPGDFIVEYFAQSRGWFYTLHVLATAIFDRPAFATCVTHGIVLGDDGQKMSKSLGNFPDVYEMFDRYGADAMRWFLMASPILRGGDLVVTEQGIRDAARQVMLPLWNAYYFLTLYANADNYQATWRADSTQVLDRYIVAKLHDLVADLTTRLDRYDIAGACAAVRSFLDVLTNWYVRRSRSRFWGSDRDAFDTLFTTLEVLTRVAAPLLPMETEEVHRGLTGRRSVHLTDWPDAGGLPADPGLVSSMDAVRDVCSAALSVRKSLGLRVRQPLASLTVAGPDAQSLAPYTDLIADEVNVKEVRLSADVDALCTRVLALVPRALGPRLGRDVQRVIGAVRSGDWSEIDGVVTAGGVPLQEGEYIVRLEPASGQAAAALPGRAGVVLLDTEIGPELAAEGVARDVVRAVQAARRTAGLDVSDRIELTIEASPAVQAAVEAHRAFVTAETLATGITFGPVADGAPTTEVGDGESVRVAVTRA
ncbi:MAG TPA: isoleucine--tRNA ligase [Mycobacteriales bacterium]